jgi:ketosteroid isomerase-like protein
MPRDEVELVRKMYAAFHSGDAERAVSYFDEDVVVDATARVDGGIGRGRDQLRRVIGQWLASFDEWDEEIEEIRDLGGQVYVVAIQSGRAKDSGIETQTQYALLYEIRDDAITRITLYGQPSEALRAAGLEPS